MHRVSVAAAGLGLAALLLISGGSVFFILASRSPAGSTSNRTELARASSSAVEELAVAQGEIRRLRVELAQKNNLVRAMSQSAAAKETATQQSPEPGTRAGGSSTEHVCDVLDERMLTAPADGRSSSEMNRAVTAIVDAQALGTATVESLHCGGTMCRLNLEADTDGTVDTAVRAVAERLPKLFAAATVFPTKSGKRAMYLAKSGEDLRVDD